jgi:hypothetical protein
MNILSILSKDISTWDDLMQKFTSLSKKEKGDAFENITKLYFEIDPKYQFYDNIWLFSEIPANSMMIIRNPLLLKKLPHSFHCLKVIQN